MLPSPQAGTIRSLAAALAVVTVAAPAAGQPQTITLDGVVRDFREKHPDFDMAGTGHYAGSVELTLTDGRPVLGSDGYEVVTEWTDQDGNPIAPHLYRHPGDAAITVANPPAIDQDAVLDSWDPALGSYGGANVGPQPTIYVGATMPVVKEPIMGPSVGDVMLSGSNTISADLHCNEFVTDQNTEISIDGDITILCEGELTLGQATTIKLLAGSTLALYVKGTNAAIDQDSSINMNTWDPSRCEIYFLGTGTFDIHQDTAICARITAPNGLVYLHLETDLYGSLTAESATFHQQSGYHAENGAGAPTDSCGEGLADSAGVRGAAGNGDILSAGTFDQWFRDVLGVNVSQHLPITLLRSAGGVYEYLDDAFYPIDGGGYGTEGGLRNGNFTYEIKADFIYEGCTNQFVQFQGADDFWMFVNGELVLDMGGVSILKPQIIEMDRLGLDDGMVYEVRMFFANRNPVQSIYRLRTNIPLMGQASVATVSWPAD